MSDIAAIVGVVLLLLGVALVAVRGAHRSLSWAPFVGIALALLGLGVELVDAVALAT